MAKTSSRSRVLRFESIVFCVEPDARQRRRARRIARREIGGGDWRVSPLPVGRGVYEAEPSTTWRRSEVSVARAWERVYELRSDPRVLWAEPMFDLATAEVRAARADHDPATTADFEWSLKEMFVKQAWALFKKGKPGANVRIGHPDTGFTEHAEIFGARLLAQDGFNFEEKDNANDAHDTLAGKFGRNPGHGTRTSSVAMSGQGIDAPGTPGTKFVSGTAPAALLVPIRTTKSATIWNPSHLIKAIGYATNEQPCHVISISLGGPIAAKGLHTAVKAAEAAGIIVVAGAGNVFGPIRGVAYPAAFPEVIGVAASEIGAHEWDGSCRGPEIDISAPGASVWCADTKKTKNGVTFDVIQDSGTSFGTAGLAGVAALWLSFHGRRKLIRKYGISGIPAVFKQLLQSTCTAPAGWPTDTFGPGIANAEKLLKAKLPKVAPPPLRANGRKPASTDGDVLEQLVNLAYPAPRSGIALMMALVLRVPETMLRPALDSVGDEIVFSVATNLALRESLQTAAGAAIAPEGKTAGRSREEWATTIRRQLSGRSASRQLREALASRRASLR